VRIHGDQTGAQDVATEGHDLQCQMLLSNPADPEQRLDDSSLPAVEHSNYVAADDEQKQATLFRFHTRYICKIATWCPYGDVK